MKMKKINKTIIWVIYTIVNFMLQGFFVENYPENVTVASGVIILNILYFFVTMFLLKNKITKCAKFPENEKRIIDIHYILGIIQSILLITMILLLAGNIIESETLIAILIGIVIFTIVYHSVLYVIYTGINKESDFKVTK